MASLSVKFDFHFKSRGVLAGAPHPFLHFLSAQSCLWDLRCDRVKPQRKNRLRERGNDMFVLFLVIVYYIVGLLRESYLEFVAAEYYCDQCRWMAESKRNGQLPENRKWWEH